MGLVFADTLRSDRANRTILAINNGAGPGSLLLYTEPQPAKGAAVTTQTLLGTLEFDEPAGTVTDGVTDFFLNSDNSADADGIAVWARVLDGDGNFVMDMTVTDEAGAGPVKMASTMVFEGGALLVVSVQFVEGNA
jgi:hypothetical protein